MYFLRMRKIIVISLFLCENFTKNSVFWSQQTSLSFKSVGTKSGMKLAFPLFTHHSNVFCANFTFMCMNVYTIYFVVILDNLFIVLNDQVNILELGILFGDQSSCGRLYWVEFLETVWFWRFQIRKEITLWVKFSGNNINWLLKTNCIAWALPCMTVCLMKRILKSMSLVFSQCSISNSWKYSTYSSTVRFETLLTMG